VTARDDFMQAAFEGATLLAVRTAFARCLRRGASKDGIVVPTGYDAIDALLQ
jgi:hypothetical protein